MYKIVDNFLDDSVFKQIQSTLLGVDFPWFIQPDPVYADKFTEDILFAHIFYRDYGPNSNYFSMLLPLLEKINCKSLIRIKGNLYPNVQKYKEHELHVDQSYSHLGAIYHITTNNGFTILKDGTKIESIENRMVFFDTSVPHKSTTCTNQKFRININFNYF